MPLDGLNAEYEKEATNSAGKQQREELLTGPNPDGIRENVQRYLLERVRKFDAGLDRQKNDATETEPTLDAENVRPAAVGLRVRFTGRTRFGTAAVDAIPEDARRHIYAGNGDVHYFIESIQSDTRPEIDLQELAQRQDPVGLLAQRLLWLEQPEGTEGAEGHAEQDESIEAARQRPTLIEATKQKLDAQAGRARWNGLPAATPDPVEWLRKSGFRALDMLLAQKGESP